jgi:hypothetical protein
MLFSLGGFAALPRDRGTEQHTPSLGSVAGIDAERFGQLAAARAGLGRLGPAGGPALRHSQVAVFPHFR